MTNRPAFNPAERYQLRGTLPSGLEVVLCVDATAAGAAQRRHSFIGYVQLTVCDTLTGNKMRASALAP